MLNLDDIRSRVHRGLGTPDDMNDLLAEVERLYGQPTPPAIIALEAAQASQAAAEEASKRAADAVLAAQEESKAAADRAATAKAVADIAAQAATEKAASEKKAADDAAAAAILSEKQAVADSLKAQMDVPSV